MADSVIVAFSIQQSQIINYLGIDIAAMDYSSMLDSSRLEPGSAN